MIFLHQWKEKGDERRKYVRFTPAEPIQVRFRVVSGETKYEQVKKVDAASTKSLGGGGMFIEVPILEPKTLEQLLLGKKLLALEIDIPTVNHTIDALAKVVWVEVKPDHEPACYGLGVAFIEIDEKERNEILDYIVEHYLEEDE